MGFSSLLIEFRPISNRIPEYHHFEEQLQIGRHNSRKNRCSSDLEVLVDQVSDLSSHEGNGPSFWAFCSSRLTFLLNWVLWVIRFSAEAILASSNSKSGPGVPPDRARRFDDHPLIQPSPLL